MDSSSLSLEEETPEKSSQLLKCVVCGSDFSLLSAEERESHLNACLDRPVAGEEVTCSVCSKVLSHLTEASRHAHVLKCLDEAARNEADAARKEGKNELDGPVYACVLCGKDLSGASVAARGQHVKTCAKKSNTGAAEMRSRQQGGGPPKTEQTASNVYRDPVSGFTRTIAASAAASSLSAAQKQAKAKKRSNKKKDRDDDLLVVADDDEMAHIALALAASLGPNNGSGGVGGGSGGSEAESKSSDKGVPVQSLQLDSATNKKVDLAGFQVPTLSQVVNEVAPQSEPQPEQYKLPASKLVSSASKRSMWKKASERPNVDAGSYVAVERTPVLPVEKTPVAEAAPQPQTFRSPDPTPVKRVRRNVVEVDPRIEAQVCAELSDIGNAYASRCREALEKAKKQMEEARIEYFVAIGKCAVDRDCAVEELLARYQLHQGHLDALPMQPCAAAAPPSAPALLLPPEAPMPQVVVVQQEEVDDDDGVLVLAEYIDVDEQSPPKKPKKDKEEMNLSPIAPAPWAGGLDTPAHFTERPSPPFGISPVSGPPIQQVAEAEPDWNSMTVEELKRRMGEYGLQAGTEKFMREKLQEIWKYSHRGTSLPESLVAARNVQMREVPESDEVTPVRKKAVVEFRAEATVASVVQVEKIVVEAEEEPHAEDLDAAIVRFIKTSDYFTRVLLFEPIPMLQLQEDLKSIAGVKVSKQNLAAFLDKHGVDFLNPDSKWK